MRVFMVLFKTMLLFVVLLTGWNTQALAAAEDLPVQRFTDLGGGKVRWEQGTLFVNQGYIPTTSSDFDFKLFKSYPRCC
jgi:hypothetical protein